jgi:hypothetical protein
MAPIAQAFSGSDLLGRLDDAEQRLLRHSREQTPHGLTEPDEGGTEQWEAGQVWAHIAEFVPYWHEQLESVIGEYDGTPVPFGRVKTDPGRIEAIELNRNEPVADQMARTHESIASLKRYLDGLTAAEWGAVGLHPTRGEMTVEDIVERFEVNHLEEHADQLDGLRAS